MSNIGLVGYEEPTTKGEIILHAPTPTAIKFFDKPAPKRKKGQAGLGRRCVNRARKNRTRNRIAGASRRANRT